MTPGDERLARIEEKVDGITQAVGKLVSTERYDAERQAMLDDIREMQEDRRAYKRLIFGAFMLPLLIYLFQTLQSTGKAG